MVRVIAPGFGQAERSCSGNKIGMANGHFWPACLCAEDAARFMGWPPYFLPLLARAGHLKPLGRPVQNSRKWYATTELERLGRDPEWLDKAIRIVDRMVREANGKQRGKGLAESLAV
jgi:hypothetical protein